MWYEKLLQQDDTELLLDQSHSPSTSPTSTTSEAAVTCPARGRRTLKFILGGIYYLLIFVKPSFLRRTPRAVTTSEQASLSVHRSPRKHSMDYLNGVRGLASFIVFVFHWTKHQYPSVSSSYDGSKNHSLWQLPMIRFVYSGPAMVPIFFVVSGYVLTYRFVRNMYRREYEALYSGLTSLAFRRAIRLFLPVTGSIMLAYVFASLNLIKIPEKVDEKKFHHGWRALINFVDLETNPWTWELSSQFYNSHLWTIVVEFRGSMVVFLIVLALSRCRAFVRVVVQSLITWHAFGHKRWDVALFVAGMLIAEVDLFVTDSTYRKTLLETRVARTGLFLVMLAGIWLAGYPRDDGTEAIGFTFTANVGPSGGYRRRFWLGIAGILIVGPMPFLPMVQHFFDTCLAQYLGKISFALYLIHGTLNGSVGNWIARSTWVVIGKEGVWNRGTSFIVSSLLYTPIVIWWADVYWRAIDIPSTRFAKWLEGKCTSPEPA